MLFQVCLSFGDSFLPLAVARSSMYDAVSDRRKFRRLFPSSSLFIRSFYSSCNN